jgi:hypothetical protein
MSVPTIVPPITTLSICAAPLAWLDETGEIDA